VIAAFVAATRKLSASVNRKSFTRRTRTLSAAAQRKIAAALRAKWARVKAAKKTT
jgi:hypothetical protein